MIRFTIFVIGFLLGLLLGAVVGFITAPLFIVPFYIILELFTSYSRYDIDPMPLGFWQIVIFAIAGAFFCSATAAGLYKRWNQRR